MPITDEERASAARSFEKHTPLEYRANAMRRAAILIEARVADWLPGYHKNWNLVDAMVLREQADLLWPEGLTF